MTDEEKQAIEDDIEFDIELKYLNNQEFNINECFYILKKQYFSDDAELKAINYLEQFINKQQKEIEKLKSKKYILNAKTKEIKEIPISDDYISKDKIKEKIEEVEKKKEKTEILDFKAFYSIKEIKNIEINILKEILGESKNE